MLENLNISKLIKVSPAKVGVGLERWVNAREDIVIAVMMMRAIAANSISMDFKFIVYYDVYMTVYFT